MASWLAFALLASASALWSLKPEASFTAGLNLTLVVVSIGTLAALLPRLPASVRVLVGGWTILGFLTGLLITLGDILSGHSLMAWLLQLFDLTGQGGHTWVRRTHGTIVKIAPEFSNWNIAGANVLLWPVLLLMSVVQGGRWWKALTIACIVLVAGMTFSSVHETSVVALGVGGAMFIVARLSRRVAIATLILGFATATALAVPVLTHTHSTLRLHHAAWVPQTLQARFVIWNHTAENVRHAPLIGIGAHCTKYWRLSAAIPRQKTDHWQIPTVDNHAHNFFLQIWFELGALGALVFGIAGIVSLRSLARMKAVAQPFAMATTAVGLTLCSATWNLWHLWLIAAFGIAVTLLALGNAIAGETPGVSFREVWLPKRRLRTSADRSTKQLANRGRI